MTLEDCRAVHLWSKLHMGNNGKNDVGCDAGRDDEGSSAVSGQNYGYVSQASFYTVEGSRSCRSSYGAGVGT
jgi:hypothetical protein